MTCQLIYIHDPSGSFKYPRPYAQGLAYSSFLLWFEKFRLREVKGLPKDPELESGGAGFQTQSRAGNRALALSSRLYNNPQVTEFSSCWQSFETREVVVPGTTLTGAWGKDRGVLTKWYEASAGQQPFSPQIMRSRQWQTKSNFPRVLLLTVVLPINM